MFDDNDFPFKQQSTSQHSILQLSQLSTPNLLNLSNHAVKKPKNHLFRFVEDVPGRMGCLCVGGYPLQPFKITLGRKDITSKFHLSYPSYTIGNTTGLNNVVYRTLLWSAKLTLTSADDRMRVVCSATVTGLYTSRIEGIVDVVCESYEFFKLLIRFKSCSSDTSKCSETSSKAAFIYTYIQKFEFFSYLLYYVKLHINFKYLLASKLFGSFDFFAKIFNSNSKVYIRTKLASFVKNFNTGVILKADFYIIQYFLFNVAISWTL